MLFLKMVLHGVDDKYPGLSCLIFIPVGVARCSLMVIFSPWSWGWEVSYSLLIKVQEPVKKGSSSFQIQKRRYSERIGVGGQFSRNQQKHWSTPGLQESEATEGSSEMEAREVKMENWNELALR
ncbi:hypothetical protein mRhiFer1_008449 [Rhinolophus ferrumequinum]|uniref:Uncharacterized protein n=1 Tax=Rhinolophus ferrumequinum TaxID=59479 RepID=A0A7J7V8A1_RHIFE|nr:hypothetical protein mRhiFer1_008449 [Rhinolophus ferrumequinum]